MRVLCDCYGLLAQEEQEEERDRHRSRDDDGRRKLVGIFSPLFYELTTLSFQFPGTTADIVTGGLVLALALHTRGI